MKKLKLLTTSLLLCLLANNLAAQLQQIKIVNFTVKNQLPATIDSWMSTPGALVLVAQKIPSSVPLREPRLVVQIKSGGAVICGNNMATGKQIDPFDVRTFSTADLIGMLSSCYELKEGTYTICAQFFNIDKIAISKEVCKDFRVEATNIEYSPPTLITPDNGKKFTAKELQSVVTFSWTPLVPKPKEPVTYRLKVWQLMQGQSVTTAMRTNQPIVTKDVDNITQATVSGIYTGPCRPPYLCDYIWQVQALNRSGKPMGNNNGMSEPYTFGLAEEKTKCPGNLFPEDKKKFTPDEAKKEMLFRWTPVVPKPQEPVTYRLKVWQLMQGQNSTQAMRTNKPIVTKDVADITEATVSGIYTGPCRPPYLCDYVWTVEAKSAAGQTGCSSEPSAFSVASGGCVGDLKIDSVKCTGFKDGKNVYRICITYTASSSNTCTVLFNNVQNATLNLSLPANNINNIIYSFTAGTSISNMTPPIGSLPSSLAPGASISACFDLSAPPATTSVTIGAFGLCNDGMQNVLHNTANDLDSIPLPTCLCDFCKEPKYNLGNQTVTVTGNTMNIVHPIGVTVPPGVSVAGSKAEIIGFERYIGDSCMPCNKDASLWGNFINGTWGSINGSFATASSPVTGNTHHTIYFTGAGATPFNLNISVPPLSNLSCCCDKIIVTIRYTFIFKDASGDCKYCSQIVKYKYQRGNCSASPVDIDPNHSPK